MYEEEPPPDWGEPSVQEWAIIDRPVPLPEYLADRLQETEFAKRRAAAQVYRYVDELRLAAETELGATWTQPDSIEYRELRAEVAALLDIHERSATFTLDTARMLVHVFPATLEGLYMGEFTERHARILVEQATGLPEHLYADYEARVLPKATELVPSRFEKHAAKVRERLDPKDLIQRHRAAEEMRRTSVDKAPDGMAWYGSLLSAEHAVGADAAVTAIAKTLMVDGETRTLAQIKADVFRDLLTDPAGLTLTIDAAEAPVPTHAARRGIAPKVHVHVPVLTAMGKEITAGLLEGFGPIDAETARELAGTAPGWIRILTDPETGAIVSYGRTTYRPPAELKAFLRIRDEVCRFVGCTRLARDCDIDHTVAWVEDGETVASNLAHLCPNHHAIKHHGRWKVKQSANGDGTLTWTSWTGRVYTSKPAVKIPTAAAGTAGRGSPRGSTVVMTEWLPNHSAIDEFPPF